jgi:hypothetical protein
MIGVDWVCAFAGDAHKFDTPPSGPGRLLARRASEILRHATTNAAIQAA